MSASARSIIIGNQRSFVVDADHWEMCFQFSAAALAGFLGQQAAAEDIAAWERAQPDIGERDVRQGTDPVIAVRWWRANGYTAYLYVDSLRGHLIDALSKGHPVHLMMTDNANGDPTYNDPNRTDQLLHWIGAYGDNGNGTIQCANPWGVDNAALNGRDVAYGIDALCGAFAAAIEIVATPPGYAAPAQPARLTEVRGAMFKPGTSEVHIAVVGRDHHVWHEKGDINADRSSWVKEDLGGNAEYIVGQDFAVDASGNLTYYMVSCTAANEGSVWIRSYDYAAGAWSEWGPTVGDFQALLLAS